MMKWVRRAGCLILAAVLLMGLGGSASADELSEAEQRLRERKQQQEEAKERLEQLKSEKEDLSSYIEELDAQMAEMDAQYQELKERRKALEEEKKETEAGLAEAEEKAAGQYEAMKLRIRYMYERGDTGFFDLLFSSGSLSDFLNRAEYISALTDYDRDMLQVYRETQQEIADRKAELETRQAELEQASKELEVQQETLELLIQAKNEEMQNYDAQISEAKAEVSDYEEALNAEQARVDALVAEMKRQEEASNAAPAETGSPGETPTEAPTEAPTEPSGGGSTVSGWVWPAPNCRVITDGYGGSRGHKGIDISKYGGSYGETIVAAAAGTVVVSTYSSSAGNWIVIYHGTDASGNDIYTCYMHCSQLLVSQGQRVSAGSVIGRIGNTGASFGAHLHFEIRLNGIGTSAPTVNPLNYVSP